MRNLLKDLQAKKQTDKSVFTQKASLNTKNNWFSGFFALFVKKKYQKKNQNIHLFYLIFFMISFTSSSISSSEYPDFLTEFQNSFHSLSVMVPLLSTSTALKSASVFTLAKFDFLHDQIWNIKNLKHYFLICLPKLQGFFFIDFFGSIGIHSSKYAHNLLSKLWR